MTIKYLEDIFYNCANKGERLRFNRNPTAIKSEHMEQTQSASACTSIETAAYNVILDPRPFAFLTAHEGSSRRPSCVKDKSSGVENAYSVNDVVALW